MNYCRLLSDYKVLLLFLFLLNIVGNSVWLFLQLSLLSVILLVVLSALFSIVEVFIFRIIQIPLLQTVYAVIVIILHNIVGIIDYFLLCHFRSVIDICVLNTMLLTTCGEASEFIATYITPYTIVVFLIVCVLINVLVYKISIYLSRFRYPLWTIRIAAMLSIVFLIGNAVLFMLFNISANAKTPMHHALIRVGREYVRLRVGVHIDELLQVGRELRAVSTLGEPLKMVIIIGESHSVYHTSLYGYEKDTYPLLTERDKKGELFVMQQAASAHDVTSPTMWSIFSLDSMGHFTNDVPLFPMVFKAAGYHTFMYDNEFLKNDMLYVMTNSALSDMMYDNRNTHYYDYDGDMVDELPVTDDSLAMYIVHLTGHHFEYGKRYPKSFAKFKYSDYNTSHPKDEKEIIATYDNACLYNDYVIDAVIKKFENYNSVVVYLADHGEEIYDLSDYLGHMSSKTSSDPSYQLRVPFLVWLSASFREHHPDIVNKLRSRLDMHIKTDDVSHFLIHIAGIETNWLHKNRSYITDGEYNGWKSYQEIISSNGIYTEEGENMRKFP